MRKRKLGNGGPEVSALGYGCMGLDANYGPTARPEGIHVAIIGSDVADIHRRILSAFERLHDHIFPRWKLSSRR